MPAVSRAFMTFVRAGDLPYRRLVGDDHVVDVAATRWKTQASMRNATALDTTLDEGSLYQFESVSEGIVDDANEPFVEWTDLPASFTDVVVAAHTADLAIHHVLTYDRHLDAFDVMVLPYRSQDRVAVRGRA